MTGKNVAKYETLQYINELGLATSNEIAEYRGVTNGCQSSLLLRYWKYGLLHRYSGEGKEKVYSLSDRGQERLDWLESEFEEGLHYLNSGMSLRRCRVKREPDIYDWLRKIKRCKIVRVEDEYILIDRNIAE